MWKLEMISFFCKMCLLNTELRVGLFKRPIEKKIDNHSRNEIKSR